MQLVKVSFFSPSASEIVPRWLLDTICVECSVVICKLASSLLDLENIYYTEKLLIGGAACELCCIT